MSRLVTYDLTNGVATISMDDGKANALSLAMLGELHGALDRVVAEEGAVILTGRGGIFSGGFDLNLIGSGNAQTLEMIDLGFSFAVRLLEHPAPVVIACNGSAVAMGAILLLCGDFRIGVNGPYKFVTNEVSIGLPMPWAGIEICRHRLAPRFFNRAINLSESFSPVEGVAAGYIDRTIEPDGLEEFAKTKAVELASLHRLAFLTTKQRIHETALSAIRRGITRDREDFKHFIVS